MSYIKSHHFTYFHIFLYANMYVSYINLIHVQDIGSIPYNNIINGHPWYLCPTPKNIKHKSKMYAYQIYLAQCPKMILTSGNWTCILHMPVLAYKNMWNMIWCNSFFKNIDIQTMSYDDIDIWELNLYLGYV